MDGKKVFPIKLFAGITGVVALVLGLSWGLHLKHLSRKNAQTHAANNSPLFETGDKSMKILVKAVEVETGKAFNMTLTIHQSKTRFNQMKQAVLAYLQGPRTGKDQVPVPEGLTLNEFYFTPEGMAVVDLSTSQVNLAKFGFYEETLFIRGMIETLSKNFFEVKQVKVLVDGQDAPTLGGHYALGTSDVSGPVTPAAGPSN